MTTPRFVRWFRDVGIADVAEVGGKFARFLVDCGTDSISLNPDTVLKTTRLILDAEREATAAAPRPVAIDG